MTFDVRPYFAATIGEIGPMGNPGETTLDGRTFRKKRHILLAGVHAAILGIHDYENRIPVSNSYANHLLLLRLVMMNQRDLHALTL
jgi:hypothetical protein